MFFSRVKIGDKKLIETKTFFVSRGENFSLDFSIDGEDFSIIFKHEQDESKNEPSFYFKRDENNTPILMMY